MNINQVKFVFLEIEKNLVAMQQALNGTLG